MSVKVYPVAQTKDVCDDYEVYINGVRAELNTARVSVCPFNRRWPGHQRQIEQTELINFLSFEMDEEVEIKIKMKTPSDSVRIRPENLNATATVCAAGEVKINLKESVYFTVEPYGVHRALHIFADTPSCYQVDKKVENILYYGKGEHFVGEICLQSGQILFIDEGAVVYARVFAKNAENIKILGRGILDNSQNKEQILFEANEENTVCAVDNAVRMPATYFACCKNVEIDGIVIRDSLAYNVETVSSENVHINRIKIIGSWRYNTDGVHFANCVNCSLKNSYLRTYDDTVCVRGHAQFEYDLILNDVKNPLFSCKNILIENCTIWNDWGKCLQIGTETYADEIGNVTFKNCKIIHVSGGGAMTIWLVDNAKVRNIFFQDIFVEYDDYIRTPYRQVCDEDVYTYEYKADFSGWFVKFAVNKHFEYSMIKKEEDLGSIQGVFLENIRLSSRQKPNFYFAGYNEKSACKQVSFRGLYWNGEKVSEALFEKQSTKNEYAKDIKLINGEK